ncbi:hypothetical protein Vadar_010659 [Vaccinium darrowii]|uniref:Uncharacterized protein n=1 Tax=Vaccinium darrowii TaxID=229202 RepID=A0ACB7YUZ7_9ERIC|nr:hypothetical protein Vadar_010659 [Vaccinium darrowii]
MDTREDVVRSPYEACSSGSVPDSLIEVDQFILDRVSSVLTSFFFNDTPLHLAALRGNLDFTKALLSQKPELAIELDSLRCSPLHLASAGGHVEVVQELLRVNTDVCVARDQDGRIPLHLAAMKGRVEIIQELLEAKPNSIHEKLSGGETVLHLCVKYNKLEALKTLVRYVQNNSMESLLNSRDDDGNTILHLAQALKQMDTIEYLLGIKSVKDHANNSPCCCEAGVILSGCISGFWTKYIKVDRVWLQEVRGHLLMAATLTATMAYQSILSPPGGVWQENSFPHKAGHAILDKSENGAYKVYLVITTIVLVASLCTIMLTLTGFPIGNKLVTWLLIFTVYVTIGCMASAYVIAISLVSPIAWESSWSIGRLPDLVEILFLVSVCLLAFVMVLHFCRFLVWLTNKLSHEDFNEDRVNAFLCDVVNDDLCDTMMPSSIDVVTLIFALSAVCPKKMHLILQNLKKVLKPDGHILLRGYAI